jgi:penicillin-binding protein 1A
VTPYLVERAEGPDGEILMQAEPRYACPGCPGGDVAPESSFGFQTATPVIAPEDERASTWMSDVGGSLAVEAGRRAPQVISPANAFIVTDMMGDVIRFGTGRRALALGRGDLAGKTGTSNDIRDTWFSGFNADLVATAWVGFDEERTLGGQEQGSRTALPMWIYYMGEALRGLPEHRLPMPEGVITARVSRTTGEPAGPDNPDVVFEYFLAGQMAGEPGADGEAGSSTTVTAPPAQDQIF